jgi:hypothetical protein
VTLLAVYNAWKNNKFSSPWCFENFVQVRTLKRAQDVRKQMLGIMDRYVKHFFLHYIKVNNLTPIVCLWQLNLPMLAMIR